MIDIRNANITGWLPAIQGMRNSWNSWANSDSLWKSDGSIDILGDKDKNLMLQLCQAHPSHAKFRRMITVYCNITAPLYWWKEFDTYKVGTVSNSQSTMHTLIKRPIDISDFSYEHLKDPAVDILKGLISMMNLYRVSCIEHASKDDWWQIIQLMPASYNQTRTVMLNYEVLSNIYQNRKDHKLDEWRKLCEWIEGLPYSELITGKDELSV